MDYNILDSIYEDKRYGSNNSLTVIRELMNLLDNPQDNIKFIHVAGTNGKGSTSSFLSNILIENGYKTGLYTSPHIENFNERIKINNIEISNDQLEIYGNIVKEKIEKLERDTEYTVTFFEYVTAIMFIYFYYEKVDICVLETGVGGRLDATNIINTTLISVITTIDYDHLEKLGNTLDKIAYEKSGIIKEDSIVFSYYQDGVVKKVLDDRCISNNSEIYYLDDVNILNINLRTDGSSYDYEFNNKSFKNVKLSMLGEYQVFNSALALSVVLTLESKGLITVSESKIKKGLINTLWIARLELVNKNPYMLIDGAHNKQGIVNLVKAIELFDVDKKILVIAMLKNKNNDEVVSVISKYVDEIIVTEIQDDYRKLESKDLYDRFKDCKKVRYLFEDSNLAIEKALEISTEKSLIVFTGSLYFAGDMKKQIKSLKLI